MSESRCLKTARDGADATWRQVVPDGGTRNRKRPPADCRETNRRNLVSLLLHIGHCVSPPLQFCYFNSPAMLFLLFYSDVRIQKVRPNELMFAPFAHIKGSLFTLYDLVLGYTAHIMPRFNFSAYLRHIAEKKVSIAIRPE